MTWGWWRRGLRAEAATTGGANEVKAEVVEADDPGTGLDSWLEVTAQDAVAAGRDVAGNAFGAGSIAARFDNFVLNVGVGDVRRGFGALPPPHFSDATDRSELRDRLIGALLVNRAPVVATIEGAPGSGKTVVAAQVCQDQRLATPDDSGVIWLTVGQSRTGPVLAEYLGDVCEALGGRRPPTSDPMIAGAALGEVLDDRAPRLVVVDDVWFRDQALPFLRGADKCRRLFTTRNRGIVPTGEVVEVGTMTRQEARAAIWSGLEPFEGREMDELLDFADGWALIIGLLNATMRVFVQAGGSIGEVVPWAVKLLRESGGDSFAEDSAGSLARTLEASLTLLGESQQRLYMELGTFQDDVVIPASQLRHLWSSTGILTPGEADALVLRLGNLRLAQLVWRDGELGLGLHDLVRIHLRDRLGQVGLRSANRRLVETWRKGVPSERDRTAWWTLGASEAFVVEHLPAHLAGAGLYEEYDQLATDLRWVEQQITVLGSALPAVTILTNSQLPRAAGLRSYLAENLSVLIPDQPQALTSTLVGRAMNVKDLSSALGQRLETSDYPLLLPRWSLPDLDFADRMEHTGPIGDCAISPDGQTLATASDDGLVVLWRADSLTPVRVLRGHRHRARSCIFSPDSSHLASTGMDGTIRIWRVVDGELVRVMGDRRSRVLGACWSSDGATVASADTLGRVAVWDPWTGARLTGFVSASGYEWGCSFSPDGRLLASCGEDGCIRLWDVADGTAFKMYPIHSARIRCCAFSPDGTLIGVAGNDGLVALISARDGQVVQQMAGHRGRVRWCSFSPDGHQLASAGEDRSARVWSTADGSELQSMWGHLDWVGGCAFNPAGDVVFTCGGDGTLRKWSSIDGIELVTRASAVSPAECCAPTSDSSHVLVGHADGAVEVRRTSSGEVAAVWKAHEGRVFGVSDAGERWLTAGGDGRLRLWSQAPNSPPVEVLASAGRLWACAVGPEGFACVSEAGDAAIVDPQQRRMRELVPSHTGSTFDCRFSSDGEILATTGDDGTVRLWRARTSEPWIVLSADADVAFWACDFSPDGDYLIAVGEPEGVMCAWHLPDGERLFSLSAGRGRVSGCAVAPFGGTIATCGEDGYLGLWRLRDGAPVSGVRVAAPLRRLCWVANGDSWMVAAAGAAGIYMFELATSPSRALALAALQRSPSPAQ